MIVLLNGRSNGAKFRGIFMFSEVFSFSYIFIVRKILYSETFLYSVKFLYSETFLFSETFLYPVKFLYSETFKFRDIFIFCEISVWTEIFLKNSYFKNVKKLLSRTAMMESFWGTLAGRSENLFLPASGKRNSTVDAISGIFQNFKSLHRWRL